MADCEITVHYNKSSFERFSYKSHIKKITPRILHKFILTIFCQVFRYDIIFVRFLPTWLDFHALVATATSFWELFVIDCVLGNFRRIIWIRTVLYLRNIRSIIWMKYKLCLRNRYAEVIWIGQSNLIWLKLNSLKCLLYWLTQYLLISFFPSIRLLAKVHRYHHFLHWTWCIINI